MSDTLETTLGDPEGSHEAILEELAVVEALARATELERRRRNRALQHTAIFISDHARWGEDKRSRYFATLPSDAEAVIAAANNFDVAADFASQNPAYLMKIGVSADHFNHLHSELTAVAQQLQPLRGYHLMV